MREGTHDLLQGRHARRRARSCLSLRVQRQAVRPVRVCVVHRLCGSREVRHRHEVCRERVQGRPEGLLLRPQARRGPSTPVHRQERREGQQALHPGAQGFRAQEIASGSYFGPPARYPPAGRSLSGPKHDLFEHTNAISQSGDLDIHCIGIRFPGVVRFDSAEDGPDHQGDRVPVECRR